MHFTSGEDTCNVVEVGNICDWVTDVQSCQYYQHGIGFQIDLPEKKKKPFAPNHKKSISKKFSRQKYSQMIKVLCYSIRTGENV